MKIRRGDSVVVISGNYAGSTPRRVVQVLDGGKRVLVEGVNEVLRHVRRGHPRSPQGGRLQLDMPIDRSNVMLFCGSCHRGVRVGFRYADDGAKERYCKRCGGALGFVSPPKARHAKT